MDTPEKLESRLDAAIAAIAARASELSRRPGRDFTRARKLPADALIRAIVAMGAGTLGEELPRCVPGPAPPSASAFSQQRAKLEPEAFRQLLLSFDAVPERRLWRGRFTLAAFDGTEIRMQLDRADAETHVARANGRNGRGYNAVHATAGYDLLNGVYLDADVRPAPAENEPDAFAALVRRWRGPGRLLAVCDRNFASYNCYASCIEAGASFVIRVPDARARGILGLEELPGELDREVELVLTRSRRAADRALPGYRHVAPAMRLDFIGEGAPHYRMRLRVVRFPLGDGAFENLATDLPRGEFPASDLGELYRMRWGIETSFRHLKHAVGLAAPHSASAGGAGQEVYARMVMFNYCSAMAAMADALVERGAGLKWERAVDFARCVRTCRMWLLRQRDGPPRGVLGLIAACTCPVRPGRKYARHARTWSPGKFAYRT